MSFYSYDKTVIVGKVGKDAEMRFLGSGTATTSFSVAVDRSYKKDGETIKRTIWYRANIFGKLAEICKDVKKGETVLLEGSLDADWSTGSPKVYIKQDGSSGASFDIVVNEIKFLSPKAKQEQQQDEKDFPF